MARDGVDDDHDGQVDPEEEAETHRTVIAAGLARMPKGTPVELTLNDGTKRTSTKRGYSATAIVLDDGERIRWADVASFRDLSGEGRA